MLTSRCTWLTGGCHVAAGALNRWAFPRNKSGYSDNYIASQGMYNSTGILYEESEGGVHSYCNTFGRWYNGSFCLRDWMYSADAGYIGPDHYPSLWQGSYDPRPR